MADEEILGPLWDFMRARGITFTETTGTVSFSGQEFLVEIPSDLIVSSDG